MNPAAHRQVNPWVVSFAVMLATFMEILDTTVVNVSIPHISGNLAATVEEGTWVVTSYLVSNAIVLPISGWLANYLGRKRLLLICVAGFSLTSLFCGMAPPRIHAACRRRAGARSRVTPVCLSDLQTEKRKAAFAQPQLLLPAALFFPVG